jgi:hypothetical protein
MDPIVVGTAVAPLDDNIQLQLLFSREVQADPEAIKHAAQIEDFDLALIVTGRILPSGRPARGGDSLSAGDRQMTGTLGCMVQSADGEQLILTCNHVIAGTNSNAPGLQEVFQPGLGDGGRQADRLGLLYQFWPIQFGAVFENHIDAALARPDSPDDLESGLAYLGPIAGVNDRPQFFDQVQKVGWKTQHTAGTYTQSATFVVPYGNQMALFVNQLGIVGLNGNFAEEGDSGAVVLNDAREVVGMQFAVASGINTSYVNRIDKVRQLLDVEVVTG